MSWLSLRWLMSLAVTIAVAWLVHADPLVRDPEVARAERELVLAIEIEGIPTLHAPQREAEKLPSFPYAVLKRYEPNGGADTPLREAVNRSVDVLQKHAGSFPREFKCTNAGQLNIQVRALQKTLATAKLEMDEQLEELLKAEERRGDERSPHWQAKLDYVIARMSEQQAFILEYQHQLSEVRLDLLPELDARQHAGWRLVTQERLRCQALEGKQARKHIEEAKSRLEKLAAEHARTPWELRARPVPELGLRWESLPK